MLKINQVLYKNGRPVLSADEIELKAEEVITYFDKSILNIPQRTPLLHFIEEFRERFKLNYDYNHDLGTTKYGRKILGKTQLKPLGLFVDASLVNDDRFNFVLAHELGHVILHRFVKIKSKSYEDQEIVDDEIDLVSGKKYLKTLRDWLEWQANYFASSILMPRISVMKSVIKKQKELGIRRNLGRIILEAKNYSMTDYKEIQKQLELVYSVNATNVECRLKELGILIDRTNLNIKHISELFMVK